MASSVIWMTCQQWLHKLFPAALPCPGYAELFTEGYAPEHDFLIIVTSLVEVTIAKIYPGHQLFPMAWAVTGYC